MPQAVAWKNYMIQIVICMYSTCHQGWTRHILPHLGPRVAFPEAQNKGVTRPKMIVCKCQVQTKHCNGLCELSHTSLNLRMNITEPVWLKCLACCDAACSIKGLSPTNVCRYVCKYVGQKGSAAMLTSLWSAGVTPEVNLRKWSESPAAQNKGIDGPIKGLMSSKF